MGAGAPPNYTSPKPGVHVEGWLSGPPTPRVLGHVVSKSRQAGATFYLLKQNGRFVLWPSYLALAGCASQRQRRHECRRERTTNNYASICSLHHSHQKSISDIVTIITLPSHLPQKEQVDNFPFNVTMNQQYFFSLWRKENKSTVKALIKSPYTSH